MAAWQRAWDYEEAERRVAEDEGYDDRDRPSPAELEEDDRRDRVLSRAQFTRRPSPIYGDEEPF